MLGQQPDKDHRQNGDLYEINDKASYRNPQDLYLQITPHHPTFTHRQIETTLHAIDELYQPDQRVDRQDDKEKPAEKPKQIEVNVTHHPSNPSALYNTGIDGGQLFCIGYLKARISVFGG